MLVTFTSRAYADITMFAEVAKTLLKLMGHSGDVPGALLPADIPTARKRLQQALDEQQAAAVQQPATKSQDDEPEEESKNQPSLALRALPLLKLLEAAEQRGVEVMWN